MLILEMIPPEDIGFACEGLEGHEEAPGSAQASESRPSLSEVPVRGPSHGEAPQVQDGGQGGEVDPRPKLPQQTELVRKEDVVEIAGQQVYSTSAVGTMRAACTYLGIHRWLKSETLEPYPEPLGQDEH